MLFFHNVDWQRLPQFLALNVEGIPYRLRLLHTGLEQDAARPEKRLFKPHRHNLYHILLYQEGGGDIWVDKDAVPIAPGLLVLTAPGQSHHFYPRSRSAFSYWEITFQYESRQGGLLTVPLHAVLSILSGYRPSSHCVSRQLPPQLTPRVLAMFEHFSTVASHTTEQGIFSAYETLADMLGMLISDVFEMGTGYGQQRDDQAIAHVQNFLENNCSQHLNIESLAVRTGLSVRQLQRRFKAATGTSPIDYLNHCRIRVAKQLLREHGMRVNEVADKLGFSSPCYFSKVFKERTGQAPSSYRRGSEKQN